MPGRKKELYYDKSNKSYYNFLLDPKTGARKKVYLRKVRGKTNDPEGRRLALEKWNAILEAQGMTPQKRYIKRKTKLEKGLPRNKQGFRPIDTVLGVGDRFLAYEEERFHNGEIVATTLKNKRLSMNTFYQFLGNERGDGSNDRSGGAMGNLSHVKLSNFLKFMKRQVRQGRFTRTTAIHYWREVVLFFRWSHDRGFSAYEPRTHFLSWRRSWTERERISAQRIIYYNTQEIHSLIANPPYRRPHANIDLRLIILLGLNCGFLAKEIATLEHKHIAFDISTGRPTRIMKSRTKTGVEGSWPLWPITASFLAEHLQTHPSEGPSSLVFKLKSGMPLVYDPPSMNSADFVGKWFRSHKRRVGIEEGKSFKHLRKTGATTLAKLTGGQYPLIEQLYLAHTPRSTARQHYVSIDLEVIDDHLHSIGKAILGELYNATEEQLRKNAKQRS